MSVIYYLCFIALATQGIEGFAGFGFKLQNWQNHARNVERQPVYSLKDMGDCTEMSNTLEEMYEFSYDLSVWTYSASVNISGDVFSIFNCSGIVGTIPCVVKAIGKTRDDLILLRPDLVKFEQRFLDLYVKLRQEISKCLIIKFSSHYFNLLNEISYLEASQDMKENYYRIL